MPYKKNLILLLSICLILLVSGCVGSTDVSAIVKALPEVKQFLADNPNAEIKAALWNEDIVEENIAKIRTDCGEQMEIQKYWRVEITDITANLNMLVWLDPVTNEPVCLIKKLINQTVTTTTTADVTTTIPSGCISNYEQRCYEGHVYWYDSCGNKVSKKEYCANGCQNGTCIQASANCTDSDGGINEYVYGQTSMSGHTVTDQCIDSLNLKEWYCSGGVKTYKVIKCPGSCQNGVCTEATSICVESDSGKNYYIKGNTRVTTEIPGQLAEANDWCSDQYLYEYYCSDDPNAYIKSYKYQCPNGCEDGACINATTTTTSTTSTSSSTIITTTSSTTTTITESTTTTISSTTTTVV